MSANNETHLIYVRRCHICGETNESHGCLLDRCQKCHRFLNPFYYFDEAKALGLVQEKDVDCIEEHYKTSALPRSDYPCVRGLTVIW